LIDQDDFVRTALNFDDTPPSPPPETIPASPSIA